MRFSVFLFCVLLLAGCDNSSRNNTGVLPPIELQGSVLGGHMRNAQVKAVGIDAYGQPQRGNTGGYLGDSYTVDGDGTFKVRYSASYNGPLFLVVSHPEGGENAQIRCLVESGCYTAGGGVSFNEWYDAPADFELWAVVNDAQGLDGQAVHISAASHIAAKLAFAQYVGNGTACNDASCMADSWINAIFTPQTIHNASAQIKHLFSLQSGFPQFIEPFDGLSANTINNEVVAQDQALMGLANYALMYRADNRNESIFDTLEWMIEDSLLANLGGVYEIDDTFTPRQWDLETYYLDATTNTSELPSVSQAKTTLTSLQGSLQANELVALQGTDYSQDLQDRITDAKELVADTQGWVLGFESGAANRYEPFFDANTAQDLRATEEKWEAIRAALGPNLQALFLPLLELGHYAHGCEVGSCNAARLNILDAGSVTKITTGSDPVYSYSSSDININVKPIEIIDSDGNRSWQLQYEDGSSVEIPQGKVTLESAGDAMPVLAMAFASDVLPNTMPKRISLTLPRVKVEPKESTNFTNNQLVINNLIAVLQGTKDVTRPSSPMHYNIESVDIPLDALFGVGSSQERLQVQIKLNSSRAAQHYPASQWPNLDVAIDKAQFKQFAAFESDQSSLDSTTNLAGFLSLPSDLADTSETLTNSLAYDEKAIDPEVKSLLNLSTSQVNGYAELDYFGDKTALVIFAASDGSGQLATRCVKEQEVWQCEASTQVNNLGCDVAYGKDTVTINKAMSYLKKQGCLDQVTIQGRGVYDIQYENPQTDFISGDRFDLELNSPYYLGIESMNLRIISRLKDAQNEDRPIALMNILAAIPTPDKVSLGISVTEDYKGLAQGGTLSLLEVVPVGNKTLWVALGTDTEVTSDALVFYIQNGNITLNITAFNYNASDNNPDHDQPLGYVRYAGELLGTLYQEGSVYVIRYVDGTWQLI